jgi:two-component system sensor histidine kinase AlgZ
MCLLLADFLRETLALGARDRVALSVELALVRRFLAVEQVRFGDRLQVEIDAGLAGDAPVPPLLLQPLVENAVTHGIAHLIGGGVVRVRAERRVASLVVTVDNPCDPERPHGRGTGLGLRNVRERLTRTYGGDAFVQAGEAEGRFAVRIEMPLPAVVESAAAAESPGATGTMQP